VTAVTAKHR